MRGNQREKEKENRTAKEGKRGKAEEAERVEDRGAGIWGKPEEDKWRDRKGEREKRGGGGKPPAFFKRPLFCCMTRAMWGPGPWPF